VKWEEVSTAFASETVFDFGVILLFVVAGMIVEFAWMGFKTPLSLVLFVVFVVVGLKIVLILRLLT
jgi:uncharacterized protein (DUF983 family)